MANGNASPARGCCLGNDNEPVLQLGAKIWARLRIEFSKRPGVAAAADAPLPFAFVVTGGSAES